MARIYAFPSKAAEPVARHPRAPAVEDQVRMVGAWLGVSTDAGLEDAGVPVGCETLVIPARYWRADDE